MNGLTIGLAIYGAVLSTINLINTIWKNHKKVKIFLEYVTYYERYQLRVINNGHRPISISNIFVGPESPGVPVLASDMFSFEEGKDIKFPFTIQDGGQVVFSLSDFLNEEIRNINMNAKIEVYAEGKTYSNYEKLMFNPKYGYYGKLPNALK